MPLAEGHLASSVQVGFGPSAVLPALGLHHPLASPNQPIQRTAGLRRQFSLEVPGVHTFLAGGSLSLLLDGLRFIQFYEPDVRVFVVYFASFIILSDCLRVMNGSSLRLIHSEANLAFATPK